MAIIYQALNLINGKLYIGQTKNSLDRRKITHKYNAKIHNNHFARALRKYSFENFEWSVLEENIELKNLNDREIYWISKLNTFDRTNGYNSTSGGEQGTEVSLETREKLRITSMNNTNTKGFKYSEETKSRMSIAFTGRKHSKDTKKKIGDGNRGKKMSKESIIKRTEKRALHWEVIDPEGNTFIIKNLRKFSNKNKLSDSNMYAVAKGKLKQHKGWKCKKIHNVKNLKKFSPNT